MGKVIVTMWITLDGFVSGADDNMDFVGKFFDADMGNYEKELVDGASTLLLGRKTYESFAGSWPKVPDNPDVSEGEKSYARVLNSLKKIVYTKSLDTVEWENSEIRREIDIHEIKQLSLELEKDLVIYGSASIIQQLTSKGIIDEYQFLHYPVFLGKGAPLFPDQEVVLKLIDSKKFGSGVSLKRYTLNKE